MIRAVEFLAWRRFNNGAPLSVIKPFVHESWKGGDR